MKDYQELQNLYAITEIKENCVDVDFAYAFISAMASSELDLYQWMPMLFVNAEESLSSEEVATKLAQKVLAIYENCQEKLSLQMPIYIPQEGIIQFANGYLQALMLIDNVQALRFVEGSAEENLQQTCLLLLDKLATPETNDAQKLAMFEQLPSSEEIVALLPSLLSHYGAQCLRFNGASE
ncbi:hypothetical protein ACLKMH_18255 [Psychromonas sp. KJ10-10]|uniref:hypothetical protein n=1 Tax=Psychromonas sp. KJ10-10 TaxID=3391823 RepID=UPI0039B60AC8